MIPAAFDYVAPTSVDEALSALADVAEDTKVLAGGQSLIPVLRMRLNAPEKVVDLGKIEELRGIRDDGDAIVVGAMTTYAELIDSDLICSNAAVLCAAIEQIADPQIRRRGTIGGSLVHADPAGDVGAPILALGAEMVIRGTGGERTVPAGDFFVDLFETVVAEGELLTAIRIPKHLGWGGHYEKFVRTAQQWSIVAVAASVKIEGGVITDAAVGLTNMGNTPLRAAAVEEALRGQEVTAEVIAAAAAHAAEGTNPPSDLNGDAAYRSHLVTVLTRRAITAAVA